MRNDGGVVSSSATAATPVANADSCIPQPPAGSNIIEVPANGSVLVDFSSVFPSKDQGIWAGLTSGSLLTSGTLKDSVERAELILTPLFAFDGAPPQAPKVVPLWVRSRFWSDGWQEFCNLVSLVILLAAGGIVSIWVHAGIPNTTRALNLKRRLEATDIKVKGLGGPIDSRWRVLLAKRLEALKGHLNSTLWVFPSFSAVLDQCTKDVEAFEVWVDCVYTVGLVLQEATEQLSDGLPPTMMAMIHAHCRAALAPMESGCTTPEEIQKMQALSKTVTGLLESVVNGAPISDLESAITERQERLRNRVQALAAALPEFESLAKQATDESVKITPKNYIDRDTATLKLDLLNDFQMLRDRLSSAKAKGDVRRAEAVTASAAAGATSSLKAGAISGPPVSPPDPPDEGLAEVWECAKRIDSHADRFMKYIRPESPASLERAELFLREMKEDIYTDGLRNEIDKQPPALDFVTVPSVIDVGVPIIFRMNFSRDILNGAAATREWRCEWDFGDDSQPENGWSVFHYFRLPGTYVVKVTLHDLVTGEVIKRLPERSVKVGADEIPRGFLARLLLLLPRLLRWVSPETKLELARLMLVLAAAVIGLVAVAQQKVEGLTFLQAVGAVAALGFGADTLKNLVTRQ
jgi:hypothetical protein